MPFAFVLAAHAVEAAVPSDTSTAELDHPPTATARRLRRTAGGTESTNVIAPSDLRASFAERALQGVFDQNDLIESADSCSVLLATMVSRLQSTFP